MMYISPIKYGQNPNLGYLAGQNNSINYKGKNKVSNPKAIAAISAGIIFPAQFTSKISHLCNPDTDTCGDIQPKNNTESNNTKEKQPKHHPEFYKLKKMGYDILASSYFRRGGFYGSPSEDFVDVINALRLFFNNNTIQDKNNDKVKMLIGGIGESQESYSILATVKSLIGKAEIGDVLDLYTVDLQGQPSKNTIFNQSYYDAWEPRFVRSSFIEDDGTKYGFKRYKKYRVRDEIFEYLYNVYTNSEKAKWRTRIQKALKEYPDNEFKIVSINNTLGYIQDGDARLESIKNIYRILKPGGIFISDNRSDQYRDIFTTRNSVEIYPGIFKKL